jgi:Tfp pilus assembly PilM family ATPase
MGKTEELTATDKLLQVIKGKNGETEASSPIPPSPTPTKKPASSFKIPKIFNTRKKKSINIGIEIGVSHLRLVKAVRKSSREWQILDVASFAYPPGIIKDSASHKQFIEGKIRAFCNVQECGLWALLSSSNVEIRHLRIPKLAKKDISNAVYWTFKKEFPFDDAEFTMDYDIQEEILVGGSAKLSVMAYISPKIETAALNNLFSSMGLTLTGITIPPFAVQNILKSGEPISAETLAFLHINDNSSRIDVYSHGNLAMTRVIKSGTGSMAEALCDGLRESHHDCSYEDAVKTLNQMSSDAVTDPVGHTGSDLSGEQIFGLITPALDRIVRQIERTFEYYSMNFGQASVQTLLVSGEITAYEPLAKYFGNQLGLASRLFDPADNGMLPNAAPLSRLTLSERMAFIPVLGAACSENYVTPNLLYGYRDRETTGSVQKTNRAVFAGFLIVIFVCAVYFINQNIVYSQKKDELKTLESKLSAFSPVIDKNVLMAMAAQIQKTKNISQSYAARYQSMAILSEISSITPREIKLLRLDFGSAENTASVANDKSKAGSVNKSEILIEGIIQGERSDIESLLTGYTFKLDSSPLFESITIQKSSYVPFIGREALQFVVNAKIS